MTDLENRVSILELKRDNERLRKERDEARAELAKREKADPTPDPDRKTVKRGELLENADAVKGGAEVVE
ncbi:MAG: hypothetical protein OXQ93_14410 [Gemmatimonadota bacterium]|nr:hypothetical protein [Gemmatimonadota bacterium]